MALVGLGLAAAQGGAQARAAGGSATFPAVMLSDLHFDPFHDPAKVPALVKAPLEQWEGILEVADSPEQKAEFDGLQKTCKAKESMDAPYALLSGALKAAKTEAAGARFVVVSGDLLVHDLDCRYRATMKLPKATGDDQSVSAAFAEKTSVFVMKELESVFAGLPVYIALGNNDSRCDHNRMDVHDEYMKATGQALMDGLVGVSSAERKLALATFESAGYYGVTMAAPMKHTRLLVVDDVYMMTKFANCEADETDQKGAQEQIAWLTKELDGARKRGERVWVVGHLPPAVNVKSPLGKGDLCGGGGAEAYLPSGEFASALTAHADVVKLALFGHTHMDELHLLGGERGGVAVKVVASISPVDGNTPSFTVGKVDAEAATLTDYAVYKASNVTGAGTTWAKEYGFDETYHEPDFSAKTLGDLIGRFRADDAGTSAESQAYQQHYAKNGEKPVMAPFWEGYVCSLDHAAAAGFNACACGGK